MSVNLKLALTRDELQIGPIQDVLNKYILFASITNEAMRASGNSTAQKRKAKTVEKQFNDLYDEIMQFKVPPIVAKQSALNQSSIQAQSPVRHIYSSNEESDDDGSASQRQLRSLRSRSRSKTPTVQSTPTHQKIRSHIKPPSSAASGSSSNILSAAINLEHPTISATKIRQLLRADSAQKKQQEERERQERLKLDRKVKEERAEAQKRKIMQERADNAKLKREQRTVRAAELRKAREAKAKCLKDEALKKQATQATTEPSSPRVASPVLQPTENEKQSNYQEQEHTPVKKSGKTQATPFVPEIHSPPKKSVVLNDKKNETFVQKKEPDNIDISVPDTTADDNREKAPQTASWARAPHLREALINQFSKPEAERRKDIKKIFPLVSLPVELVLIFGEKPGRHLVRTSSAVWSPVAPLKRTRSMVATPDRNT